jgi:hypothetical protein
VHRKVLGPFYPLVMVSTAVLATKLFAPARSRASTPKVDGMSDELEPAAEDCHNDVDLHART